MISNTEERLPLGAVRTADGKVVVPASRRADGSTRKTIRIRQGYVPQDEVPKYKPVAQRRREQHLKCATGTDDAAVDEILLDKLSLEQKEKISIAKNIPRTDKACQIKQQSRQPVEIAAVVSNAFDETSRDQQQLLKRRLTKLNRRLKEIAKLESAGDSSLTAQQKDKILRKSTLQQHRNEIIAKLNESEEKCHQL